MSTFQWLLALHVTGAFLVLGGNVFAALCSVLALRTKRASEVDLFLGLSRVAVAAIISGALITLVLGLWLVRNAGFSYGKPWIVVSIVLWVVAGAAGSQGGRREERAQALARQLAVGDDAVTPELSARLRDPVTLALSWASILAALAILALMIWKPGE